MFKNTTKELEKRGLVVGGLECLVEQPYCNEMPQGTIEHKDGTQLHQ